MTEKLEYKARFKPGNPKSDDEAERSGFIQEHDASGKLVSQDLNPYYNQCFFTASKIEYTCQLRHDESEFSDNYIEPVKKSKSAKGTRLETEISEFISAQLEPKIINLQCIAQQITSCLVQIQ